MDIIFIDNRKCGDGKLEGKFREAKTTIYFESKSRAMMHYGYLFYLFQSLLHCCPLPLLVNFHSFP